MGLQQDEQVSLFMEDIRKLMTQLQIGGDQVLWRSGMGSPEGIVPAIQGSLYTRLDGGSFTTLYVKTSGDVNSRTGWLPK